MRMGLPLPAVAVSLVLLALPVQAATIHVPGDEPTIQAGINAASEGDTVLVAAGVYSGPGNRGLRFHGKAITVKSQEGYENTVIDCEGLNRAFTFDSGEVPASVLDGFTLCNGRPLGGTCGGAVEISGSSPTILNCHFLSNGGGIWCGGAFFLFSGDPTFEGCTFSLNEAQHGGAVWLHPTSATFTNCVFSENSAEFGGAIYNEGASPSLIDCTFSGNTAETEGGVMTITFGGHATFAGCTVFENTAPIGAVVRMGEASLSASDSSFWGNHAALAGGVLACWTSSDVALSGCALTENSGGYMGGAIYASDMASITAGSCTIASNAAQLVGGIAASGSASVTLQNSILALCPEGTAVACEDLASVTLVCCDVYGNAGGDWVGCIEDQLSVSGNFSEDPLFCLEDAPEEPYSLHEGSPCLSQNSPCGELVGAFGLGCGPVTPVEDTSWGAIKAMFR